MVRSVKRELLDDLPSTDSAAMASRRDLRRLNVSMRSALLITAELRNQFSNRRLNSLLELGAGDGTLLLSVARLLPPGWEGIEVTLLDQQDLLTTDTRTGYESLGWRVRAVKADLFEWLEDQAGNGPYDAVLANLFLHHFTDDQLRSILARLAVRTRYVLALEPRRCRRFWLVTRLLWFLGCNHVTRYDARISVQAGFAGSELSSLWPAEYHQHWRLKEHPAGFLSHLFTASRTPEPIWPGLA